jgi:hypothetical protein
MSKVAQYAINDTKVCAGLSKVSFKSSIFLAKDHYLDKKIWEGILWHFMELPSHISATKY